MVCISLDQQAQGRAESSAVGTTAAFTSERCGDAVVSFCADGAYHPKHCPRPQVTSAHPQVTTLMLPMGSSSWVIVQARRAALRICTHPNNHRCVGCSESSEAAPRDLAVSLALRSALSSLMVQLPESRPVPSVPWVSSLLVALCRLLSFRNSSLQAMGMRQTQAGARLQRVRSRMRVGRMAWRDWIAEHAAWTQQSWRFLS